MKYIERAASFLAPDNAEWNDLRACEIFKSIRLHSLVSTLTKAGKNAGHLTLAMNGHYGITSVRLFVLKKAICGQVRIVTLSWEKAMRAKGTDKTAERSSILHLYQERHPVQSTASLFLGTSG